MAHEKDRVIKLEVPIGEQDVRLDRFLASRPLGLSRSRIQYLIKSGAVQVNSSSSKPSYILKAGDQILVNIPPPTPQKIEPEPVAFEILYEDESIIVINKPPGLVVHPAPGHLKGTLVHGLLYHCKDLAGIGGVLRPGIVHRLDKDTSGLMVVAKNDQAHEGLVAQFKAGKVKKEYIALVHGVPEKKYGSIETAIGRHPKRRKEMAVTKVGGKVALTFWKVREIYSNQFSLLSLTIKTGRTHQIRVHLSYMGYPVVGDPVYGYGKNWWKRHPKLGRMGLPSPTRQMLHSCLLGFTHPIKNNYKEYSAPLPEDMKILLEGLKKKETS